MNIESYVFLICFVFLGIVAFVSVGWYMTAEKELAKKKLVIKELQKENRILNLQVGALKELAGFKDEDEIKASIKYYEGE